MKTYGAKASGIIEVRISGTSVRKPGRYFLSENTSLLEAVKLAEITGGQLTVQRSYNTSAQIAQARFAFDISTDDGIQIAQEFLLEENDVVIVGQLLG